MIQLDFSRHAAVRVAQLQAEADVRRLAAGSAGTTAKALAALLRNWASRLDHDNGGAVRGAPAAADMVSLRQLGQRV